ncbi:hypothetical protein ACL7TT_18780 [Microbulbifer sp. 2304DJ12-6]|uniref:hypothetical protein n=1 Tax=Microbulbifer sp. 2304DJ12-6 TaxID=3233340 RepID=UPI0039B085EF
MSNWERQYREEVSALASPQQLDVQILQQAKHYQHKKDIGRLLSKVSLSGTATVVLLLLVHPVQLLGALTPGKIPEGEAQAFIPAIPQWQAPVLPAIPKEDPWLPLHNQVAAGNYIALCREWRTHSKTPSGAPLPRELRRRAQKHCRILPQP